MPASPFFTSVPFGLNAQEMNAWVYEHKALELWRRLYEPYHLIPFPGGNTLIGRLPVNAPVPAEKDPSPGIRHIPCIQIFETMPDIIP